jgi:hypothetical protein
MIKILNCLNLNDVLPYECELRSMGPADFFKKLLVHFLRITPDKQIEILPRAVPIIAPFQRKFLG